MKVLIATLLFSISSLVMAGGAFNAPNPYDPRASSSNQAEIARQEQYAREQKEKYEHELRERDNHERRESDDRERREHGDSRQGHYR
jgi:hypothetical protein